MWLRVATKSPSPARTPADGEQDTDRASRILKPIDFYVHVRMCPLDQASLQGSGDLREPGPVVVQ